MTAEEIVKKYIKGNQRHAGYYEAVDIENHLSFHIDGYQPDKLDNQADRFLYRLGATNENPYFSILIDQRRPGETAVVQKHRRIIYASITREPCFKVISSLNKIVRSDDWKIDYSQSEKIKQEGESLEDYCEHNYPNFGSVTNWLYTYGLKKILSDPNGMIVILPIKFDVSSNEFLQPYTNYVSSEDILYYEPGKMIAYKSDHVTEIKTKDGVKLVPIYRIISTESVWEVVQNEDRYTMTEFANYTNKLPVIPNGGIINKLINNIPIYNSFLAPMLPRLDEAAREYSDLQAEVLLHIHSTLAVIQGDNCNLCSGTGKVLKDGKPVACGDCKGRGALKQDPYDQIVVRIRDVDKQQIPFPPAQYITKSTDIVKIQEERIENHLYKALSSLNMEFLAQTPLNQSGTAKEIDKEELNNFVYSLAFHLVNNIMNPIYECIAFYRYNLLVSDTKTLLPLIQVPEHFDLLTENHLIEQIKLAKEASIEPTIIKEMQVDYINKKFRDMPNTRDQLIASIDVNPFPTSTTEEIIDMELNRDITKKDAVLAIYSNYFVQKAIHDDKTFLKKDFNEQLKVIENMTDAKIKEIKDARPVQAVTKVDEFLG